MAKKVAFSLDELETLLSFSDLTIDEAVTNASSYKEELESTAVNTADEIKKLEDECASLKVKLINLKQPIDKVNRLLSKLQ